jgi:hypothetical protein
MTVAAMAAGEFVMSADAHDRFNGTSVAEEVWT